MKARYQYRIYPHANQIAPLAKAFGCARVVWNDALAIYKEAYREGRDRPKNVDKQVITQAKLTSERAWLAEVSNIPLQQSFRDLQQAWSNFFNSLSGKRKGKKVGCPKFKKKQSRQAIRFRKGGFSVHSESVKLAKIGHIRMVMSRPLPSEPSSVTIIKDTAGRYFASFVVEVHAMPLPPNNNSVGIDLGLTHFAILSSSEKIENPRFHKKRLRQIKKANRKLSKCKFGSRRREMAKRRLAKLHAKIKDCRTDFLHKLTTRLVRENQALAIEDLNVAGLVRNRKLARAISDASWSRFRQLLTAKCDKYNRQLVVIDRWEPTSQTCSCCGFRGGRKELSVREWQCLSCYTWHDRDICAANNIKLAGGLSESINGRMQDTYHGKSRRSECKTGSSAVRVETPTTYEQLSLF